MRTVAFVPIKLNSERMPGKNTHPFSDGTTLLTFFLKTLSQVKGIDACYVFCSDPSVKQYLLPEIIFLERPVYLDTAQATPQDIISEFISRVPADIYMTCHCTSPFVTVEHLEECITAVQSGQYDSAFTAEKMQRLLWNKEAQPLNFQPDCIPRTQDLEPIYCEVSAAYVFRREVFECYKRRIGMNPFIVEVSGSESIDIDYPEDFMIADAVYMRKNSR